MDVFAQRVFGYLPRADQRRWAGVYLKGLLFTEGRKSMRRLAESASSSPTAWYSLQQFINDSPWKWDMARHALTRWIEERSSVRAWVIAPVVLPKRGACSVGVHRRFIESAGRALNCQVGITLFLSCPGASFPVDWRLFLPDEWVDDIALRRRTRIPGRESFLPKWKHALDLLGSMAERTSLPSVPVVADMSDVSDIGELIARMDRTQQDYVVAINPRVLGAGVANFGASQGLRGHGVRIFADGRLEIRLIWRNHTATVMTADGTFRQARVQSTLLWQPSPVAKQGSGDHRACRLFTELVPEGGLASPVWLTNLVHHRLDELLELTRHYMSSTITATCLDERFRLLDFAGRSFPAWHHHMTMVSAAYAYMRIGGVEDEPLFAGWQNARTL